MRSLETATPVFPSTDAVSPSGPAGDGQPASQDAQEHGNSHAALRYAGNGYWMPASNPPPALSLATHILGTRVSPLTFNILVGHRLAQQELQHPPESGYNSREVSRAEAAVPALSGRPQGSRLVEMLPADTLLLGGWSPCSSEARSSEEAFGERALSTSAGSQPPSPPPLPAPNGPLLTRLRRPPSRSLPPIPSRAGAWEQTRRSRPPRGRPLVPPCDSTLLGGWSTSPESSPLVPSASSPCPRSPLPAVLAAELRSLARPITPSSSPALPQPRPARLFRCIPMHPPRLAPAGPPLPSDDEIVNTSTSLTSPRNGGAWKRMPARASQRGSIHDSEKQSMTSSAHAVVVPLSRGPRLLSISKAWAMVLTGIVLLLVLLYFCGFLALGIVD